MTVLIDSNIWIDYFEGSDTGRKIIPYIEGEKKIVVSPINIAEVFRQFLKRRSKADAQHAVNIMLNYAFVVPIDVEIAVHAALLREECKLGLGDAFIYATAQLQKALLVTRDNDFRGMKDVIYLDN